MTPAETAAVDQIMAGGNELLDSLVADSRQWLDDGAVVAEVFQDLYGGALDSDASRAALAGVNALAVLRLARAEQQADEVYRDAYRTGREHAGGGR